MTGAAAHPPHALGDGQLDAVACLFSLLADPTRLKILNVLSAGPATVTQIVRALGMKQPNVSKHLNLLYHCGVVGRQRDGLQVRYSVRQPVVFTLCAAVCEQVSDAAQSLQQWRSS